jgi:hypothetical protein
MTDTREKCTRSNPPNNFTWKPQWKREIITDTSQQHFTVMKSLHDGEDLTDSTYLMRRLTKGNKYSGGKLDRWRSLG